MNIIQIKEVEEIKIPSKIGVYILTNDDGEILYVGKSKTNLIGRIANHKYAMQFSRAFYIKCSGYKEMDKLESQLILKCRPKYNMMVDRKQTGLLNKKDIKEIISVDARIINHAAAKYNIEMVMIGSQRLYHKNIIKAVKDYINSLNRKPLSYGRVRN